MNQKLFKKTNMKTMSLLVLLLTVSLFTKAQSYNWKPVESSSIHAPLASGLISTIECPTREGCSDLESEMQAQVAAFNSCMAEKVGVIIDAESITYDNFVWTDAGTIYCWGYLHHYIPRHQQIVELK